MGSVINLRHVCFRSSASGSGSTTTLCFLADPEELVEGGVLVFAAGLRAALDLAAGLVAAFVGAFVGAFAAFVGVFVGVFVGLAGGLDGDPPWNFRRRANGTSGAVACSSGRPPAEGGCSRVELGAEAAGAPLLAAETEAVASRGALLSAWAAGAAFAWLAARAGAAFLWLAAGAAAAFPWLAAGATAAFPWLGGAGAGGRILK